MKKNERYALLLVFFVYSMIVAVGNSHLLMFVEGPLRYSGFVVILISILLLVLTNNKRIIFTENAIEIKALIGRKKIVPYESVKSIEYIETIVSGGHGIRTKIRNIKFHFQDGSSMQFAETQISYKKCVMQLLEAYDNGKLPSRAIKPATRERLLNSINKNGKSNK